MCIRKHPMQEQICNFTCNSSTTWEEGEVDIHFGFHKTFRNNSYESFDYRNYSFPNVMWIRKPNWELALKGTGFLVMVIVGVIGNVLLLNVVLRNRSIRTPTNLLIANMALADLTTLLLLPWVFLSVNCFQNYMLGEIGCRGQGFAECALLLTGVLNLVAVSYDRLTAIMTPMEAQFTVHGTHIVMATTWVTGMLLGMPLIFLRFYKEREWKNFYEIYCTEDTEVMPIYWYVIIVFIVWLPLAIMVLCYAGLFIKLDQYEKRVLRRFNPKIMCYKTKVARTIFVVVLAFLICRIPFTALIFYRAELQQRNDKRMNQIDNAYNTLWLISHYLFIVNAAINPFIYGLTNENFRKAFRSSDLARWLFGGSSALSLPRTPRLPVHRLEPIRKADNQHWFHCPEPKKALCIDYM